ncbi:MAG: hypothetical protein WBP61_18060 [Nocardioides sp.]
MTATLPVPVRFELPNEHWRPVPPQTGGVQNAAFLALRDDAPGDYTPSISVSGDWRTDDATLEQIADESLAILRGQGASDVELVKRTVIDSEHAPAITQAYGGLVPIEGRTYDIRQAQAVQGLVDVHDPTRRVVVIYTLTCVFQQFDEMVPEFQKFMASVEVVPGESAG